MENDSSKNIEKTQKNETIERNRDSLDNQLNQFILDVSSLLVSSPIVKKAMDAWSQDVQEEFNTFISTKTTIVEEKGKKQYLFNQSHIRELETLFSKVNTMMTSVDTLYRSYIIAAISSLDVFLDRVIKWAYINQPGLCSASEKVFSYKDLLIFGSFGAVQEKIISSEIEAFDRLDYVEKIEILKKKYKVDISSSLQNIKTLVEVSARRNIFVHNNGVVNEKYLFTCKKYEIQSDTQNADRETEQVLSVTNECLNAAVISVLEYGFVVAQEVWRHFKPEEVEAADGNVNRIGFDMIQNEDYVLAKMILNYAYNKKPHAPEELRKMIVLNLAQTYKWMGDEKTCLNIINKEDWSADNDLISTGKEVLLENYEKVYKLMNKIGKDDAHLTKESYRNWPIFRKIRQESRFQNCFNEIFDEQLLTIDPNSLIIETMNSEIKSVQSPDESKEKENISSD